MFNFKPQFLSSIDHLIPTAQDVGSMDCRLMHAPTVKCRMVCRRQSITGGGLPPGANTVEERVKSAFDGVDTLSVALEGANLQAQLLFQLAADEPAYAVGLP